MENGDRYHNLKFDVILNYVYCYVTSFFNLQKVQIEQKKVEEEAKKVKVTAPKIKKAEELPEIPDYDRPDLEKYEKISPTPTTRDKPEKDKVLLFIGSSLVVRSNYFGSKEGPENIN